MNKTKKLVQNIVRRINMKKGIFIVVILVLLTGCTNISNTPTKQVEGLFNKYQTLDQEVLNDLDKVIDENNYFSEETRQEYREIIKKQYKNLTYKIKEETVDADAAIVTVEINVVDFSRILASSVDYKNNNLEEFLDENGQYQQSLYSKYVIEQMKDAKERIKYTLDIKLSKIDDEWRIDGIDSETEDKILGIYQY